MSNGLLSSARLDQRVFSVASLPVPTATGDSSIPWNWNVLRAELAFARTAKHKKLEISPIQHPSFAKSYMAAIKAL